MSASYPASPAPADWRAARLKLGLTHAQAAALLYRQPLASKRYESGERELSPAEWEYWQLLTGLVTLPELIERRQRSTTAAAAS